MVEDINLLREKLLRCLKNFRKSIDFFEKAKEEKIIKIMPKVDFINIMCDSLIKSFELSDILFWEYLQKYLEYQGFPPNIYGPSPVIRTACKANLIFEDDAGGLLEMVEDRNELAQDYYEELVEVIIPKVPQYYELMKKYADKLVLD